MNGTQVARSLPDGDSDRCRDVVLEEERQLQLQMRLAKRRQVVQIGCGSLTTRSNTVQWDAYSNLTVSDIFLACEGTRARPD